MNLLVFFFFFFFICFIWTGPEKNVHHRLGQWRFLIYLWISKSSNCPHAMILSLETTFSSICAFCAAFRLAFLIINPISFKRFHIFLSQTLTLLSTYLGFFFFICFCIWFFFFFLLIGHYLFSRYLAFSFYTDVLKSFLFYKYDLLFTHPISFMIGVLLIWFPSLTTPFLLYFVVHQYDFFF